MTFNDNPDLLKNVTTGDADFFHFTKLKAPIKGKRFTTIEEIKEKLEQSLLVIRKSVCQMCFEDLKIRWCISYYYHIGNTGLYSLRTFRILFHCQTSSV